MSGLFICFHRVVFIKKSFFLVNPAEFVGHVEVFFRIFILRSSCNGLTEIFLSWRIIVVSTYFRWLVCFAQL